MEGDIIEPELFRSVQEISIHSLRMEGDTLVE